ncbi:MULTISPECIES: response regulator [unclassified Siphonobacter]|uniref:response regulator n=1 Tax=unclassified Siphonobacter TaxID=2635712 RepID=UPI000CB96FA5|nr:MULTISPECIES: response regulator [unclassified Siphonobacter]MDQ1086754.1 CheY-like chemotaxis protein [Siphonobacter sp. SORGH_AS_1065]MDR6197017.1 CheY-like chemotaxis protein [Siphonobacter sp. SORGH_AS_0500]PKK36263.1 two-component system response regulator [Siphonobacter sp. SORGH_AS_0500]
METISKKKPVVILIADDDEEDREMTQEALEENFILNEIHFVEDGLELLDYLLRRGKYENPKLSPRPGLILLDLNMPRMDGREALKHIKSHPDLRRIPVIILTTSHAEEDILRSYDLGVNCFITKPVTFRDFIEVTKSLGKYWFEIVQIPVTSD